MNKKGEQESSSTGAIIAAVIAAAILVIVLIGVWMFMSGKLSFFQGLPSFNDTKPLVTNTEIFRYYLPEDKLQFYDGTKWEDFRSGESLEINNKKVYYTYLYDDLTKNYIGQNKIFEWQEYLSLNATVKKAFKDIAGYLYGGGSIGLHTFMEFSDKALILDIKDNYLYIKGYRPWHVRQVRRNDYYYVFATTEIETLRMIIGQKWAEIYTPRYPEPLSKKDEIAAWRDSLINQTVRVWYQDSRGNWPRVETCYFESKYYDKGGRALVVDLSRVKGEKENCPFKA